MDATTRLAAAGNVLLGGWLIAAPFVFDASGVTRWNDVLVGAVIALIAGYNYTRVRSGRPATAIGAGFVALLGCWLVVAPFVLGLGLEGPALWTDVVVGTVVASFGSYNAYAATASGRNPSVRVPAE